MKRRRFVTTMGALPWLPGLLPAALDPTQGGAKALILIWLDGGLSHLDTFDGKPEAPSNIRGDLSPMKTALDGVFVSEHLPKVAKMLPEACLVRSVTSPEGNHDRGSYYMLTGRRLNPVLTYPSFGSLLGQAGKAGNPIPSYVAVPDAHPYARQGFLPTMRAPFEVGGRPGSKDFSVRHLQAPTEMRRAMELLGRVDALDGAPRSPEEAARDRFLEQARHLSLDPEARGLFDLSKEDQVMHQLYGRHQLGQSCLLARRLVAGGVRTVLVRDKGWDHHQGIKRSLTFGYPPKLDALDEALSALHADLKEKGMLDRVTVMLASEFGRTPRLNAAAGRDHWPRASSTLLFGGGLREGVVVGKTDARGEEPVERPVSPESLFLTVLSAMGVETGEELVTADGRPIRLVDEDVAPVHEILAG